MIYALLFRRCAPALGKAPSWLPWLVLIVVIGGAILLIQRFTRGGKAAHGMAMPPQAVGVATATTADMQVTDAGLGTVTSLATVTVQSQISGILQTVGFQEGQLVKKGDFLAQIDPRPTQALLDQARGTPWRTIKACCVRLRQTPSATHC